MSNIELNLWWESRQLSLPGDAHRLSRFVSRLPEFDPIYRSWLRSPKPGTDVFTVPLSESQAAKLLTSHIGKKDNGDLWPEMGSRFGGGHAGAQPYDFQKTSYADTFCRVGSFNSRASKTPNHIFMRLSEIRPSTGRPWRASELRNLMVFAYDLWKPSDMCAIFSFYSPPKIADPTWAARVRPLQPWIGWITYLPSDLAARANVPPDVHVDPLDDGGALLTLCEEPFDEKDAAGLARLHALEAALRPLQT